MLVVRRSPFGKPKGYAAEDPTFGVFLILSDISMVLEFGMEFDVFEGRVNESLSGRD